MNKILFNLKVFFRLIWIIIRDTYSEVSFWTQKICKIVMAFTVFFWPVFTIILAFNIFSDGINMTIRVMGSLAIFVPLAIIWYWMILNMEWFTPPDELLLEKIQQAKKEVNESIDEKTHKKAQGGALSLSEDQHDQ